MKHITLYLFAGLCLFSCQTKTPGRTPDLFASNIDSSIEPGDDFFSYANGKWIKNNPIPPQESSWGIGYIINNENQQRIRDLTEEAAKEEGPKGSVSQKVGDFWLAAMDSAAIEQEGIKYLEPWFESIDSIRDISSFIALLPRLNEIGVDALFGSDVEQDDKNSLMMSFRLSQGGLGLPDRDYYFNQDSSTVNIRNQYTAHVATLLKFTGMDSLQAIEAGHNLLTFETKLAKVSRKLADLRDPYSNYHKMPIRDLSELAAIIDWTRLLREMGASAIDSVIVGQPEFFKSLDPTLQSTPVPVLKEYLKYRLIKSYAQALPDKFGKESFRFDQLFSGATQRKERWKRVIQSEQGAIGELLGQLYVKKYFDTTAKKRYVKMLEEIRSAYKARIQQLTWMSDSTKQKAVVKLEAITPKIGYPDQWKDFSKMDISRESYVQNLIQSHKWWHHFEMNKLGKPVDRTEWHMYPQTYNAYYNPANNEIVFPAAAFMIPGYADKDLDDAVMYGYVGASYIGHEITHGFDDQGRLYDAQGNLHNWWSTRDSAEFTKRASVIIKQFDEFEPLPGTHINGRATQGENIADLGGLEIGIDAFKKSDAYKNNELIGGLTPMQRFFMGYALSWLYEMRPELLKTRLMTDVHAPAKYRVNGPFSNIDEFYSTFEIKPGDKMFRPDSLRVRIW